MAKTFYIPVNGQSKKPKKWYVPVNGLSKEAKKAYCPVNLLSKLFWGDGSGEGIEQPVMIQGEYIIGQSYSATRASIEDTVRFLLEKMVFINRYSNSSELINTIEDNIDEIVAYVQSQLQSSDNQCIARVQPSSSSKIYINVFIGHSNVSSVTPTRFYNNMQFYPYYGATLPSENCRMYCQFEINSNGTVNKNTYSYTGQNLNIAVGYSAIARGTYDKTLDIISFLGNLGFDFSTKKTKVLADWDFAVSNIDKIDGMTAQSDTYGSLTPVPFTEITGGLKIPPWPLKHGNVFELGIGTITNLNLSYAYSLLNAGTFGIGWQSSDGGQTFKWQIWSNFKYMTEVREDIGVTDPYAFQNSVVKLKIDSNGYPSLYKDNVLVHKCTQVKFDSNELDGQLMMILGGQQCTCTITHLKIYIE